MSDQLIANATLVGDRLLVVSCGMDKIEVAFNEVACLRGLPKQERGNFMISEEGSYLYWPQQDIHLDLDALRYVVDPQVKSRIDHERLMHDQRFGKAIATLRKKHHLKQSDIKGLSERQVSRIEQGGGTKVETLKLFAQAHQMNLNDYLNAVAEFLDKRYASGSIKKKESDENHQKEQTPSEMMGFNPVTIVSDKTSSGSHL